MYSTGQLSDPSLWRAPTSAAQIAAVGSGFPVNFPMYLWTEQSGRYLHYWNWFTGRELNEEIAVVGGKEKVLRFPLQLNEIRTTARKHATVLLGEETFDSARPTISTLVKARSRLSKSDAGKNLLNDDDFAQAELAQAIINEVWIDSNARSIQAEAATGSQFLGGWAWKVEYSREKLETHRIPVTIKSIMPDFFLPIYSPQDPYNLIEAYVIYRITAAAANAQYGTNLTADARPIYCEHWTRNTYSVFINGEPVRVNEGGETVTYLNLPNIYGFVPFVYIPHLREGGFYGSSIVPDTENLIKEYNARQANMGDAVRATLTRRRWVRNVNIGMVEEVLVGNGVRVFNLGNDNPISKNPPDIIFEDPPNIPVGVSDYPDKLWLQILRESNLSDIAFGEDEGSQRSALTLAFRMWPITSHVRMERANWTDGFVRLGQMIIAILLVKRSQPGVSIPAIADLDDDILKRVVMTMDWLPMIPRDREQQVNEIILRFQSGTLSLERALEMYGDIPYVGEEVQKIKEYQTFLASIAVKSAASTSGASQAGAGAQEDKTVPVASDGLKDG